MDATPVHGFSRTPATFPAGPGAAPKPFRRHAEPLARAPDQVLPARPARSGSRHPVPGPRTKNFRPPRPRAAPRRDSIRALGENRDDLAVAESGVGEFLLKRLGVGARGLLLSARSSPSKVMFGSPRSASRAWRTTRSARTRLSSRWYRASPRFSVLTAIPFSSRSTAPDLGSRANSTGGSGSGISRSIRSGNPYGTAWTISRNNCRRDGGTRSGRNCCRASCRRSS